MKKKLVKKIDVQSVCRDLDNIRDLLSGASHVIDALQREKQTSVDFRTLELLEEQLGCVRDARLWVYVEFGKEGRSAAE